VSAIVTGIDCVAAERLRKRLESGRGTHIAADLIAKQLALSLVVHGYVQIVFRFEDDPLHVDAGKQSPAAGVGQDFGVHQRVGRGAGVPANRPRCDLGFAAELEPVLHQPVHALVVHEQQEEVGR